MLSVPGQKIPRKISIKIARAEKLKETKKEGKNKVNNKFKVTVLGGKNKESSNIEISSDGNVQWRFSCVIKLHKVQNDPLALLVEDSDGHHKGQVIIPIVKIPPKPYTCNAIQDPANSNNILCSELEPTSKCNNPSGFLLYWIWVEEFFSEEQLTSGKRSFNKSMGSIFGSKHKLGSSKTNLDVKNSDSVSNFGSHSTLNKPEKQKKSSSFINLKIGKKKKSKPTSDNRITPDSSDVETASNFSFNPAASVNPFENDPDYPRNDRLSQKNNIFTDGNFVKSSTRHSGDSYNFTKQDIHGYGNQDNISEAQLSIKSGDKKKLAAFDSVSKVEKKSHLVQQEPKDLAIGKTLLMMSLTATMKRQNEETDKANNPFSNNSMVPIKMPPYGHNNSVSSDNNSNLKSHSNSLVSSTLPNKYNTMKELPTHRELNNEPISISQNENESTYRPGHNKSTIGSDYSIFNQIPAQPPNKGNIDESENLKKENLELKLLNNRLAQQINDLTTELESVKQTLCKLRLKLLDEGALKYLEI